MNTETNFKKGYLFIVSGPSGVGKTVLCNHVVEKHYPKVVYSISTTSRAPRGGETDGQEYNFCTTEDFEDAIAQDAFAEWANVHGNYYGTPKKFLIDEMEAGRSVVLNIDVQGALEINKHYPDAVMIFILPPTFEELENRIRKRNIDSENSLKNRLQNAKQELEFKEKYRHVLVNDDLDVAKKDLENIFLKYI